jgi:CRP/FNR family cyclic AMP-dependent transcriptional regulator
MRPDPSEAQAPPLGSDLLKQISESGQIRNFPARAIILNEGDPGDSLYIIISGKVKAYSVSPTGKEVVFNILGAGEYLGELALDGGLRSASVMTLEPTTCSVVQGDSLRKFVAQHPDFALNLIQKLIRLVRRSTENVKGLALEDVYSRVVRLLLAHASTVDGQLVVRERLTQQDIADRVGSSREMVSRVFKELTRGNYITVDGKQIFILKRPPPAW